MPLYSFECDADTCRDRTEALMLLREYEAGQYPSCPTCQGPMHRIYLPSGVRATHFDPIVIHESPDGEFSFPMHAEAPVPEGFIKRQIQTFAEADQILRKVNARERAKAAEHLEAESARLDYMESRNRADLRSLRSRMSPRGRAFMDFVIAQHNARRPQLREPNVFLEIREFDRSNRDEHRDAMTGWKGRHV